jgi:hypothetical protein
VSAKQPNIVCFLWDNLAWGGEVGCYGGGVLRGAPTPRVDQLAADGLRLLNFKRGGAVHPESLGAADRPSSDPLGHPHGLGHGRLGRDDAMGAGRSPRRYRMPGMRRGCGGSAGSRLTMVFVSAGLRRAWAPRCAALHNQ